MKIAIIDAYHEFHFELIKKLQGEFQHELVYLLSGTPNNFHGNIDRSIKLRSELTKNKILNNEITDFLFPSSILKLNQDNWYIDEKLLEKTKSVESLFLRLTDRSATLPISVHERRFYFLIILNYFYSLIKEKEIDYLICFDTPHSFPSNCFYELAKLLNVEVIRLEYHYLPNYSLVIKGFDMPDVSSDYLKNANIQEIEESLPDDVLKDLAPNNSFVQSYVAAGNKEISEYNLASKTKLYSKYISKKTTNLIQGLFPFFFKKEILHFTSLNELHNRFKYRMAINEPLKRIYKLNLYYNKLATVPDLSVPYIYFGLHMQPEKTSLPLGGEFGNQFLAIKLISKYLPEGWRLIVKEHPNQFNLRKVANANFRSTQFYDAIQELKNVDLAKLSTSSSELIQKSRIVTTITGTTGMEALTIGRPVLCFGQAYYKSCKAVVNVTSKEDLITGIEYLCSLSAEEVEKELKRYISYYLDKGYLVKASNWESKMELSSVDRKSQIENLASALNSLIQ